MAKEAPPRPGCLAGLYRAFVFQFGQLALLLVVLAITPAPWMAYRWLGNDPNPMTGEPDVIVMLGGGGIPSESGLMRAYQAARVAAKHPTAQVIVAMPLEPDEKPGELGAVAKEIAHRGVASSRIRQEGKGRHTREQAVRIREMLGDRVSDTRVLIVTSPEHMRRSLLTFLKAGFPEVHGASVYSEDLAADLHIPPGDGRRWVPNVGGSLMLRYRIWDNLELEVRVMREFAALLYYKAKGWI